MGCRERELWVYIAKESKSRRLDCSHSVSRVVAGSDNGCMGCSPAEGSVLAQAGSVAVAAGAAPRL